MFHIAFCINNKFTMPCGVFILSILHYNKFPLCFHVLHRDLTEENIDKLKQTVSSYSNAQIEFHKVDSSYDSKLIVREGERLSVETYYRFFIPELLPNVDKVLYLDCDMLCCNDFSDIFNIDIENIPEAMVIDEKTKEISKYNRLDLDFSNDYFNAGVMYINLDYWRKNNETEKLLSFVTKNPELCVCHDQDAVNKLHEGKIQYMPLKYNCQRAFFRYYFWVNPKKYPVSLYTTDTIEKKRWPQIKDAIENPTFVHFSGCDNPWFKESTIPYLTQWVEFHDISVWQNEKLKSRFESNKKLLFKIHLKKFLSIFKLAKPFKTNDVYPEEAYTPPLHDYTNKWIISNYINAAYSKTNKELAA